MFETPTKVAAFLALASYALGVLSVSFYVQHKDIPAPDLTAFKPHYIYTGLVVLGLLAAAGGLIALCLLIAEYRGGWLVAIGVGGALAVLTGLVYQYVLERDGARVTSTIGLVVTSGLCALFLWWAWKAFRRTPYDIPTPGEAEPTAAPEEYSPPSERRQLATRLASWLGRQDARHYRRFKPVIVALLTVIALAAGVTFADLFGRNIYEHLPKQFGGGRPSHALILFTPEGAAQARQLGVPLRPGSQVSEQVTILLDDEAFYAVSVANGPVVQLAKSSVDGLLVDSTDPTALDVQTRNHTGGIVGRPEQGDQLILTYSEAMRPQRLIPGWSTKQVDANLTVRSVSSDGEQLGRMRFTKQHGKPALGTIDLSTSRYTRIFRARPSYPVTLRQRGSKVIITLEASLPSGQPVVADTLTWSPSQRATDIAGNTCQKDPMATEGVHGQSPVDDPEF